MPHAWQYSRLGKLSQTLEKRNVLAPTPGKGEIVVDVRAAALNPVDEQLAQSPPSLLRFLSASVPSPSTPLVPASDFAGVVSAIGDGVTDYHVGERVFGMHFANTGNGFLSERVAIPQEAAFVTMPRDICFTDAAALPLAYMTVYDALVEWGRLDFEPLREDRGKYSVLILGGSSGTGSMAIMLAKRMGLHVVATCSAKNVEWVRGLGADEVIDYTTQNVTQEALMSRYAPYAVVLDCVGGTDLIPHLVPLIMDSPERPELGIYITIVGDKTSRDTYGGGATNAYVPSQAIRTWLGGLNDILPRWMPGREKLAGRRYACIKLVPTKDKLATVAKFLESARAQVDSVWGFDEVREAYERLESARARGKMVVEVCKEEKS